MIQVENGHYVVRIPELGIYQPFAPNTLLPFGEAEAVAFEAHARQQHADVVAAEVAAANAIQLARKVLTITAEKTRATVGQPLHVRAEIRDGLGDIIPIDDDFAVPICDDTGAVVSVKLVTFVKGKASATYTPTRSGYLHVTEQKINEGMPEGLYLELPEPLRVVVFE